jgi:DNA-binding LacI/PurR family transcriptional regulator/biotin operon repressor
MDKKPLLKELLTEELRQKVLLLQADSPIKIATERELAESMGVSRISIRAAIKALVEEGLLIQHQGRGTYIRPKEAPLSLYILCAPDRKSNDPYYNEFLLEMTNSAARSSIQLTMVDPAQHEGDPEGVLIVMGLIESDLFRSVSERFKHVIALQSDDKLPACIHISYDDAAIGRHAADILLEHGHRRLYHLAGPDKYPSAADRKRGFISRLAEVGIQAVTLTEKMNWPGGYRAGDLLLKELSDSEGGKAAVFAANDWMAVGLIQKLKESGIRVPEDVSVIGCDNISLAGEYSPALATFSLNMKDLVAELLNAVFRIRAGEADDSPSSIRLPARFLLRQSLTSYK